MESKDDALSLRFLLAVSQALMEASRRKLLEVMAEPGQETDPHQYHGHEKVLRVQGYHLSRTRCWRSFYFKKSVKMGLVQKSKIITRTPEPRGESDDPGLKQIQEQ